MTLYLRLLLAHLPAFLIGLAMVELLWPRRGPAGGGLKLALAPGLGWGISTALFFLWSQAASPYPRIYPYLEWGFALGLSLAALWSGRKAWTHFARPAAVTLPRLLPGAAALLVFAAGGLLLWLRADAQPSGNFDAYAIWNMRARFLFLSDARTWKEAFSPALEWWTHADYPLLWPLALLRAYFSQGRILSQAGVFQAWTYGAALLGLFIAGLRSLHPFRSGWQAVVGGMVLLGLPWFVNYTAFQQSDVPLAYFYLATLILLLLYQREAHPGLAALAGLAAGCAAWTKNDGIVFLVAAAACFATLGIRRAKEPRLPMPGMAAFGAGLILPLAALLSFKLFLAPPGDLIGAQSIADITAKLLDPSRYLSIGLAIVRAIPTLGGLPWPAAAAGAGYLLLAGFARRVSGPTGARLFMLPSLTLLGYCAVYLITPHTLEWHLGYSLDRLLFHLLIPALFLALVLVRSPEELAAHLRAGRENKGV